MAGAVCVIRKSIFISKIHTRDRWNELQFKLVYRCTTLAFPEATANA